MQTRERAHCARSVFPFIKEKKKMHHSRLISKLPVVIFFIISRGKADILIDTSVVLKK